MNWSGAAAWAMFIEYLIKTTLVLSICLLLVSVARRRSAAIRHFLLAFFLIGLLLLPVLALFRFGWETSLLPARIPLAVSQTAGEPIGLSRGYSEIRWLFPMRPARRSATASGPGAATGSVQASSSVPIPMATLGCLLPFVWFGGLTFIVLKFTLGIMGACRLTRESKDVADPAWRSLMFRFLIAIGIRREVRLKSHWTIGVPITWGLIKPVILLPGCHQEWTEDQRSSALVHELCHIKRADLLVMFLVRLSLALFWFNPLCWLVCRFLKQEQERACDELVLTAGIKPSAYAAALLFFKRSAGLCHKSSPAFLGLFGSGPFHERLSAILRQRLTLEEVTMKSKIMLAIAVILAVGLIGMARPSGATARAPLTIDVDTATVWQPAMPALSVSADTLMDTGQDKKVDVEKEKANKEADKERAKEAQKDTIVIVNKDGEKKAIRISVKGEPSGRQAAKDLVTIREDKVGRLFLLDDEGKEVEILEGKPLHRTIDGKELTVVKEGDLLKIDAAGIVSIVSGKDQPGAVRVKVAPRVRILKSGEGGANKIEVLAPKKGEDTWIVLERKDKNQIILKKEELKEQAKELAQSKEKRAEAEKIRQAIKEKTDEIVKRQVEIRKGLVVESAKRPMTLTYVKPGEITVGKSGVRIIQNPTKKFTLVMTDRGEVITITSGINPGEGSRATYERVVAGVKQLLAEGYTLEPEFNDKSGAITLKISGPAGQKIPTELVKKVLDVIRAEIKQ